MERTYTFMCRMDEIHMPRASKMYLLWESQVWVFKEPMRVNSKWSKEGWIWNSYAIENNELKGELESKKSLELKILD